MQEIENARNYLHHCRVRKIKGMENGRKGKSGKRARNGKCEEIHMPLLPQNAK